MSAIYSDRIEGAAFITRDVMREVEEAVERVRVVGVLDAWTEKAKGTCQLDHEVVPAAFGAMTGGKSGQSLGWVLVLIHHRGTTAGLYRGATPDAARAAAAKAIESGGV